MRLSLIFFAIFFFILTACKKDNEVSCPEQQFYPLPNFIKQFNFKKNSKWVFINTATLLKDTTWATTDNPGYIYSNSPGTSKECPNGNKYEEFNLAIWHNTFLGGSDDLYFNGTTEGLKAFYNKYCNCSPIILFDGNINDSIKFNNNTNWCKIENKYQIININGNTYNNVYQMYYYPDLFGFKRIWWCPNIGFVKFEHYNSVSSQTEFWELDTYNVQLY